MGSSTTWLVASAALGAVVFAALFIVGYHLTLILYLLGCAIPYLATRRSIRGFAFGAFSLNFYVTQGRLTFKPSLATRGAALWIGPRPTPLKALRLVSPVLGIVLAALPTVFTLSWYFRERIDNTLFSQDLTVIAFSSILVSSVFAFTTALFSCIDALAYATPDESVFQELSSLFMGNRPTSDWSNEEVERLAERSAGTDWEPLGLLLLASKALSDGRDQFGLQALERAAPKWPAGERHPVYRNLILEQLAFARAVIGRDPVGARRALDEAEASSEETTTRLSTEAAIAALENRKEDALDLFRRAEGILQAAPEHFRDDLETHRRLFRALDPDLFGESA